jgi:hypothetical protein
MLDLVRYDKKAYLMYQKANETPSEYIQSFQAMIKSVEAVGGEIGGGEHVYKYLADVEGVDITTLTGNALTEFRSGLPNCTKSAYVSIVSTKRGTEL